MGPSSLYTGLHHFLSNYILISSTNIPVELHEEVNPFIPDPPSIFSLQFSEGVWCEGSGDKTKPKQSPEGDRKMEMVPRLTQKFRGIMQPKSWGGSCMGTGLHK